MTDLKTAIRIADKSENIQDIFLNNARRDRTVVHLLMMNGTKMSGKIRSFDKFSLMLEANHQDHLIFKHAIATITAQARGGHVINGGTGNGAPSRSSDGSEG